MDEIVSSISGSLSGAIAVTIWYPLETIRLRIQQESLNKTESKEENKDEKKEENNNNNIKIIESKQIKVEKSLLMQVIHYAQEIIKKEGISALYNGMSSAFFGSIQSYGVYFLAYKFWQNYFIRNNLSKGVVFDSLVTSFLGALCTSIITNPIWVLNSRMAKSKTNVSININIIYTIYYIIIIIIGRRKKSY